MEVHSILGCGFLEIVYQEALTLELAARGIPFEREPFISIHYKGQQLPCVYRPDFICFGEVIVELKSIGGLGPIEHAQVLNYLKVTNFSIGLLVNFGQTQLEYKRFIHTIK